MGKYFGTDGVRGRVNEVLTAELAFNLGLAAASVLVDLSRREKPLLLIGKDTRISGDLLEAALAAGFTSAGCDVLLLGLLPTPGVAAMTRLLEADAAAMISASHNPYYDNGIKFFSGQGCKLPDAVEERIERLLEAPGQISRAKDGGLGRIRSYDGACRQYREWLHSRLSPDLGSLRMVVDAAHGAAAPLAADTFRLLGAEVLMIGDAPDGCNINDHCGSTYLEALRRRVVEAGADIGIALDGDADRMLAVDEQGREVDGDQIIAILAADLKAKDELAANRVVVTQMSNMGLRLSMEALGVQVEETKVGDRYVLERLQQTGAVIGGEQSGHIILTRHNSTGDGLIAALALLAVMRNSGRPLSQLTAVMRRLPQVLINAKVKNKDGLDTDPEIAAARAKAQARLGHSGRLLLRPSGTEPIVRVMLEGEDEQELRALAEQLAALIERRLG